MDAVRCLGACGLRNRCRRRRLREPRGCRRTLGTVQRALNARLLLVKVIAVETKDRNPP